MTDDVRIRTMTRFRKTSVIKVKDKDANDVREKR